ncbi:MAG: sigma-70 family RNA polymerase sigma factor [Candidatus Hydrogenedentes bacterium]|nr:sigma-70 family RNA polymerase sigma factor [Candidatus Hydrogenedentota bacterium]
MDPEETTNDIVLMMRVRTGDASAFEVLFNRYQRPLLSFFYGLSHNPSHARDLSQETFLRVWKIRRRYQASGTFPAYLFAIARMIWLEYCRQQQKTWRLGARQGEEALNTLAAGCDACPETRASRLELRDQIHAALDELPEEQRIVFVLRSIEGLSLEDIANILDCPVNTVRSRKILAVKKLRYLLASWMESDPKPDSASAAGAGRNGRREARRT